MCKPIFTENKDAMQLGLLIKLKPGKICHENIVSKQLTAPSKIYKLIKN